MLRKTERKSGPASLLPTAGKRGRRRLSNAYCRALMDRSSQKETPFPLLAGGGQQWAVYSFCTRGSTKEAPTPTIDVNTTWRSGDSGQTDVSGTQAKHPFGT